MKELLLRLSLLPAVPTLLEGLNDAVCCPRAHQPPAAEMLGESESSQGDSPTGVWVDQGTTKGNGRGRDDTQVKEDYS